MIAAQRVRGARTASIGAAPAPAPASDDDHPLALAGRRRRRPRVAMVGALIVAASALAGALLVASLTSSTAVLVASHDLEPGRALIDGDLRVVEIGSVTGIDVVTVDQAHLLLGAHPAAPVPAGTVLNPSLFTDGEQRTPPGTVVLGATMDPGAAAGGVLAPGDRVVALGVWNSDRLTPADADEPSVQRAAVPLTEATVWAIDDDPVYTGVQVVSLLVPDEHQATVAQAAADGRLRLALTGRDCDVGPAC